MYFFFAGLTLAKIVPFSPIEDTVAAMDKARKEGKTKYIGLSEVREYSPEWTKSVS